MARRLPPLAAAGIAALLAALASGCSDSAPTPTPEAYSGLLTASEFVVGPNRFPFGLVSRDGAFLDEADATVRFFRIEGDSAVFHAESGAVWRRAEGVTPHLHPDGELHLHLDFRGFYAVDSVDFPAPGVWAAEFDVADGPSVRRAIFEVQNEAVAPAVGERPPSTRNRTLRDGTPFAELSSRAVQSDDLHNISVAEALDSGAPFVVFFASPQFCTSALCGPVTDTLAAARAQLGGAIEFIHIEPWDLNAARNEGRLVPAPAMLEWRLPTEPWTFVVDADGRIAARYEGLVAAEEVLAALRHAR